MASRLRWQEAIHFFPELTTRVSVFLQLVALMRQRIKQSLRVNAIILKFLMHQPFVRNSTGPQKEMIVPDIPIRYMVSTTKSYNFISQNLIFGFYLHNDVRELPRKRSIQIFPKSVDRFRRCSNSTNFWRNSSRHQAERQRSKKVSIVRIGELTGQE